MAEIDFLGKYLIEMDVHCLTGLHIGGADEGIEIEGMDNPVIKDSIKGWPYIPGSSLKGKIRTELEFLPLHPGNIACVRAGWDKEKKKAEEDGGSDPEKVRQNLDNAKKKVGPCQDRNCSIVKLFGSSAEEATGLTRSIFRDAWPKDGQIQEWEAALGKGIFTEDKPENTISRLTAEANPRRMERVPAGSKFQAEIILNVYEAADKDLIKILFQGLSKLEDSTLGGSGSRGSGRVRFEQFRIVWRPVAYYLNPSEGEHAAGIPDACKASARAFLEGFDSVTVPS